jgi:hypothetical protein
VNLDLPLVTVYADHIHNWVMESAVSVCYSHHGEAKNVCDSYWKLKWFVVGSESENSSAGWVGRDPCSILNIVT